VAEHKGHDPAPTTVLQLFTGVDSHGIMQTGQDADAIGSGVSGQGKRRPPFRRCDKLPPRALLASGARSLLGSCSLIYENGKGRITRFDAPGAPRKVLMDSQESVFLPSRTSRRSRVMAPGMSSIASDNMP
jgi:hypothetical protein